LELLEKNLNTQVTKDQKSITVLDKYMKEAKEHGYSSPNLVAAKGLFERLKALENDCSKALEAQDVAGMEKAFDAAKAENPRWASYIKLKEVVEPMRRTAEQFAKAQSFDDLQRAIIACDVLTGFDKSKWPPLQTAKASFDKLKALDDAVRAQNPSLMEKALEAVKAEKPNHPLVKAAQGTLDSLKTVEDQMNKAIASKSLEDILKAEQAADTVTGIDKEKWGTYQQLKSLKKEEEAKCRMCGTTGCVIM